MRRKVDFSRLSKEEQKKQAKEKAFKLLSIRARSERELKDKLKARGFESVIIEEVISDCKRLNLLDDRKFALSWIEGRLSSKPAGKIVFRQELFKKGIKKDLIEEVISESFQDLDETELARKLLERKKKSLKNLEETKAKKRMTDFLLRRGFSYDVINEVIPDLFSNDRESW